MMIKKLVNKVKEKIIGFKETVKVIAGTASLNLMAYPKVVFASGGSYTTQITNLKTVMTTIIVPVGAVLMVWGGIRFAIAFQKMDQNGEHSAIYTVIAGGICTGIGAVISALG